MRQKIQDLTTLLKSDRKTQVIAGAIFLAMMFLIFAEPAHRGPAPKRTNLAAGSGATSSDDRWEDLILRFNGSLEEIKTQTHDNSVKIDQTIQRGDEYEKRTAEIFKRILERIAETEAAMVNNNLNGGGPGSIDIGMPGAGGSGAANAGASGAGGKGAGGNGAGGNGAGGNGAGGNGAGGLGAGSNGGANGRAMMARNGINGVGANGYGSINGENGEGFEPDELDTFGNEEAQVVPPPQPPIKKLAVVGAGDSVRVKLLSGVNAPTDGTPYPVVFSLSGDVAGPDGSSLPLGEARLIAAAQGSLTDSRALFRLSSLNIRLPDGRRKVFEVDGWIVGEDGKRGMEGALIDPLGKILGAVAIGGAVSGVGEAIAQKQITSYSNSLIPDRQIRGPNGQNNNNGGIGSQRVDEITGDEFAYGLGKGIQNASKEYTSIIKQRAALLVPHVEVLSGREGTAIFSESFTISDLFESLSSEEDDSSSSL